MKPFKIDSLARALVLAIPAYVFGLVLFAFCFWIFLFLWAVFVFSGQFDFIPFILVAVAFFVVGVIWHLGIKLIYQLLLKLLWSNPPQWLKPSGIQGSLKTCSEAFLVTLPIAALYVLIAGFSNTHHSSIECDFFDCYITGYRDRYARFAVDQFLLRWFWFWLLSAVGYYHFIRE